VLSTGGSELSSLVPELHERIIGYAWFLDQCSRGAAMVSVPGGINGLSAHDSGDCALSSEPWSSKDPI